MNNDNETTYDDYILAYFEDSHIDPDGPDAEDMAARAEEAYYGEWYTFLDFAVDYADDCFDMSGIAARYFDYDAFANDLQHDFTILDSPNGNVFVFHY